MVATLEAPAPRATVPANHAASTPQPRMSPTLTSAPKFNIGRDALNKAVADLPDDQRNALEWLWSYCQARNLGRDRLGKLLRKANGAFYSSDSIYQLLTGRRADSGETIKLMTRAIEEFRAVVEAAVSGHDFIETQLVQRIWRYCGKARKYAAVGFIFGDMALGKSRPLIELAKRDPNVFYTRMPTRGHLNHYLQECARKFAMGDRQTVANLRARVIDALRAEPGDPLPKLLIVDEADQCFQSIRNVLGLGTLDFIREIFDAAGCGIVLVFDHHGRDELLRGQHAKRLKRLWRRHLPRLQLPAMLSNTDLDAFAASVGLPPAPNEPLKVKATVVNDATGEEELIEHVDNPQRLQQHMIASEGLFVWLNLLREAEEMAREQKRAISWGAVLKAHAEFEADEDEEAAA